MKSLSDYEYYSHDDQTIYCGDARDILPLLSGVTVVVTDPPYGLGFMGKEWDTPGAFVQRKSRTRAGSFESVQGNHNPCDGADRARTRLAEGGRMQAWHQQWAELLLAACVPGTPLLAFGGTRTYHRLVCAIEDAGWEIRDSLAWVYGSGFPKSMDVGKAIDEHYFQEWLTAHPIAKTALREAKQWEECPKCEGSKEFDGQPCETCGGTGDGKKAATSLERQLRKAAGAEREVVGVSESSANRTANNPQAMAGDWKTETERLVTTPATDAAKLWDGWGTALKPAFEPICLAMKPLDGTFAANAEKWGVAGLNVDGCRVETDSPRPCLERRKDATLDASRNAYGAGIHGSRAVEPTTEGRWPANLIHDGSDEVLEVFPETATGNIKPYTSQSDGFLQGCKGKRTGEFSGDSGSAARFFYCAKSDKAERGPGNNHPTVKPLALMSYLCKLVSMPGYKGTLLDPFAGSGSTLLAATRWFENVIGIERSEEYCEIAVRRLAQGVLPFGKD